METIKICITMENGKEIHAELYPSVAPKTVENFVALVVFVERLSFFRNGFHFFLPTKRHLVELLVCHFVLRNVF